jgi:iron complex outermembrane receptor protein
VFCQALPDIVTEDVVVTATRFEEPPAELAVGVQVLTREQIAESGATTLAQLLSRQAGIHTRDNSGGPNQQIDMRGFGMFGDQNTLILIDGQRISENEQVPANLASIPLSAIERIEILRGGGAVFYGGGATAGTINIVTRGAVPNTRRAQFRAGYGSLDTSDGGASLEVASARIGLSLSAGQYDSENYRDNNEVTQRNLQADVRTFAANGPVYLKLGAGDQDLRLPGSRTEQQLSSDRQGTSTPNDFGTLRTSRLNVGTVQAAGTGEIAADLSYRARDSFAVNQPGTSDIDGHVIAFSPRLRLPFSFAGRHVLVAGVDWDEWDYFSTVLFPGFSSSAKSEQSSSALFISDSIEVAPGTRLGLGGRLQRTNTTISDPSGASPALSQVRSPTSWEAALRQDLAGGYSVYGKTGRSFRVANVDDNRGAAVPLEPQTSRDSELGAEYRGEGMHVRAALYRMDLRNEILFLPGDVLPPFGANVNLPPTLREGLELQFAWEVSSRLALSGHYTGAVAKFREGAFAGADVSGNDMPLVPRHRAALTASVSPAGGMRVIGTLSHVGEQHYDNDQSNTFGRKMPAYTLFDLSVTLQRGPWTLSASVRNVLNEEYYTYAVRSVTAPTFNAYPAAERTVFLGAEYRLGD